MYRTTVVIDGMMCKNCEKHMNETFKAEFPGADKVESSHKTGMSSFVTADACSEEAVAAAVAKAGYEFVSFECEGC